MRKKIFKIFNKKIITIIILILLAALLYWSVESLEGIFYKVVGFFESYSESHSLLSVGIFVLLSALSVMLMFFTSILLVPIVAALWGNIPTASLLLLGWLLGGVFSYLIGRYAGRPLVLRILGKKKFEKYEELFSGGRLGFGIIILFRFILPSEIPGYVLGIARYDFWKYMLATLIGELPYVLITVYAIDAIIKREPILLAILSALWILLAGLLFYLFYLRIKSHHRLETIKKAL